MDIFYLADEFCQEFSKSMEKYKIGNAPKRKPKMKDSEVITILILFHFFCCTHLPKTFLKKSFSTSNLPILP